MPHLTDILEGIWGLLEDSLLDRRNGFRTPAIATLAPDSGCAVRTVLLRGVDRGRRCVRFYTDLRSPKVEQILKDPRAALVFQDAIRQVELRAEAVVRLHREGSLAERCWSTLPTGTKREFASTAPPGSPAGELSEPAEAIRPAALQINGRDRNGRSNFAVADCTIGRLDWLELDSAGHRRAVFTWDHDGELQSAWVAP